MHRLKRIPRSMPILLIGLLAVFACSDDDDEGDGVTDPGAIPETISIVSGDGQTGAVGTTLPQPLVVEVLDSENDPFTNAKVTWAVIQGGGTLSATETFTNTSGETSVTLTLGPNAGPNTVAATMGGPATDPAAPPVDSVTFTATATSTTPPPATPTTVELVSGDGQTGAAGAALAEPFVVLVTNDVGDPVSDVTVDWAVTAGGGTLSEASTQTDASGQASVILTLGAAEGTNTVTATAPGLTGSPVTFTATAGAAANFFEVEIVNESVGFEDADGDNVHNVAVGDTIRWTNTDAIVHTATSTSEPAGGTAFDSGDLAQNGTATFVPDVAGTWEYVCTIHPTTMTGTIIAQ